MMLALILAATFLVLMGVAVSTAMVHNSLRRRKR